MRKQSYFLDVSLNVDMKQAQFIKNTTVCHLLTSDIVASSLSLDVFFAFKRNKTRSSLLIHFNVLFKSGRTRLYSFHVVVFPVFWQPDNTALFKTQPQAQQTIGAKVKGSFARHDSNHNKSKTDSENLPDPQVRFIKTAYWVSQLSNMLCFCRTQINKNEKPEVIITPQHLLCIHRAPDSSHRPLTSLCFSAQIWLWNPCLSSKPLERLFTWNCLLSPWGWELKPRLTRKWETWDKINILC